MCLGVWLVVFETAIDEQPRRSVDVTIPMLVLASSQIRNVSYDGTPRPELPELLGIPTETKQRQDNSSEDRHKDKLTTIPTTTSNPRATRSQKGPGSAPNVSNTHSNENQKWRPTRRPNVSPGSSPFRSSLAREHFPLRRRPAPCVGGICGFPALTPHVRRGGAGSMHPLPRSAGPGGSVAVREGADRAWAGILHGCCVGRDSKLVGD